MVFWTATKQGNARWLFTWTSDSDESWDIWLDGVLIVTVEGGEYETQLPGYETEPPHFEIVATGTDAENDLYPPFAILQWREVGEEAGYLIEKKVNGTWTSVGNLTNTSKGYYTFRTTPLEDDTDIDFRVSALNFRGEAGTPIEFTVHVVRNPAPPSVTYAIDSAGDLVVGDA